MEQTNNELSPNNINRQTFFKSLRKASQHSDAKMIESKLQSAQ